MSMFTLSFVGLRPPADCSLLIDGMGATSSETKAKGATGASSGTQSRTGQSFNMLCNTMYHAGQS